LPRPFGVFYEEERACYEDLLHAQIEENVKNKGKGDLDALLSGANTWEIK
jgi:2-oxoglutarate ferredoxin oxidoreductase subunit beta